jgi:hypothetical protein
MKKKVVLAIAIFSVLAMYSFTTFNARVDDIFKTLGIPVSHAKEYIWKSFAAGNISFPANSNIRNYPASKRAAAVYELGTYVKNFLLSPDFNKQYQQLRDARRPAAPATIQQRIDAQIADYTRSLKQSEEAYRKAAPELKQIYEAGINKYKQLISSLEHEYDPQHAKLIEGITIQYDYDMGDYSYRLKKFEKEYPADVRAFIKIRLQEFLHLSANVDFSAALTDNSGTKKFINAAYEAKPAVWKYCFRAGKESTLAARSLAEQWIKEM